MDRDDSGPRIGCFMGGLITGVVVMLFGFVGYSPPYLAWDALERRGIAPMPLAEETETSYWRTLAEGKRVADPQPITDKRP